MNENQVKAEAAIERAKAMLNENKSVAVEMNRTMTDGRNTYTRNVGGVFSARTEAEFMIKEVARQIPCGEALDWLEVEAAKLGIEI